MYVTFTRSTTSLTFKSQISRNLTILADRDLVGQALSNLLDNAVKYSPGGDVEVKTALVNQRGDRFLRISIIDSGPGMDDALFKT